MILNKYDKEIQNINFQRDYILITIGEIYSRKIFIKEIFAIFFNIDKNGYYFRVMSKEQYPFDVKSNPKYRMKNKNILIKLIENKEIKLFPNFGWSSLGGGVSEYCTMKEKYLLVITRTKSKKILNKNLFSINYGSINRYKYKIINDNLKEFNLKEELSLAHNKNLKEQPRNFGIKGVLILDKSLTFNMGYAVVAVTITEHERPRDISVNIFYSFDEEEIKNKMIELLSPSYIMESETYG